ncbi:MAG: NAD(P)-dependent oxidoreductase [Betaproteobacteria bacterium]|nr:NAD(P)-dependent oxidoreductase [Betaproteobacteria bacterium]
MSGPIRTVAFLGLGLMGRLMVANLERAGFNLRTYDLNGNGNCRFPQQAASGAEVLITMVPDGKAVRQAVLAALPGLARGAIVIDMSSSDPGTTRELAAVLKKKGVQMLDAPVSGAKAKAADGSLALMVGGEAKLLEQVRPLLSKMGKEIFHTGALGSGHATKALNNYLGAAGTIAGFEALLIGQKFGLDPRTLIDVINASTGKNSTTERKIPQQVFSGEFASGFQLALMTKDVGIAAGIARDLKVEAPYLKNTLKIWRDAQRSLRPAADHTELLHYLKGLKRPSAAAGRKTAPSRAAASPRAGSHRGLRRPT